MIKFFVSTADFALSVASLTAVEPEPSLNNFHIWCRKNEIFCMFSNENPEQVLISEDMTFVNSIADGLDRFLQENQQDLKSKKRCAYSN